ncbi:hypothetical protein [Polyangium sorediatum]|uniref:Amidase domain-containing protein n=1 Tax=Polyangium sorediatum TaxID=889274 RepID=A0ABT6NQY6_9BACT|nr:hypothetical protein [Polyangium sorediatum]MDI1430729.1 hypothetical protein [Polyangium sorediatum]
MPSGQGDFTFASLAGAADISSALALALAEGAAVFAVGTSSAGGALGVGLGTPVAFAPFGNSVGPPQLDAVRDITATTVNLFKFDPMLDSCV